MTSSVTLVCYNNTPLQKPVALIFRSDGPFQKCPKPTVNALVKLPARLPQLLSLLIIIPQSLVISAERLLVLGISQIVVRVRYTITTPLVAAPAGCANPVSMR